MIFLVILVQLMNFTEFLPQLSKQALKWIIEVKEKEGKWPQGQGSKDKSEV